MSWLTPGVSGVKMPQVFHSHLQNLSLLQFSWALYVHKHTRRKRKLLSLRLFKRSKTNVPCYCYYLGYHTHRIEHTQTPHTQLLSSWSKTNEPARWAPVGNTPQPPLPHEWHWRSSQADPLTTLHTKTMPTMHLHKKVRQIKNVPKLAAKNSRSTHMSPLPHVPWVHSHTQGQPATIGNGSLPSCICSIHQQSHLWPKPIDLFP